MSRLVATWLLASCQREPPAGPPPLDSATVAEIAMSVNRAIGPARDTTPGSVWRHLERAHALNPTDDAIPFLLAAVAAGANDTTRLTGWLDTLGIRKSCLLPTRFELGSYATDPTVRQHLIRPPVDTRVYPSEVAFRIDVRDLMPENIGYDSAAGDFYIGSLFRRQIFRVRRLGERAELEPFTAAGQDSLMTVLGIKIDQTRRLLWVASAAQDLMVRPRKEEAGRSAILAYDLRTGALKHRIALAPPPGRLANDLAIDRDGNVFVTDTDAGSVYRIDGATADIEVFLPPGTFFSPNGIAVSPDGRTLFVAAWADGVWRIEVATRARFLLPQVAGPRPAYLDGLYLHGHDLIGIASLFSQGRLARFTLSARLDRIVEYQELECNHPAFDSPTTGVVVGDSLFYIANSQLTRYSKPGQPLPIDSLRSITILKRALNVSPTTQAVRRGGHRVPDGTAEARRQPK